LQPLDRLWVDCIQEEAWIESRNDKQRGSDDDIQDIASHARKRKGNGSWKNTARKASPEQGKNKDLSKVKCYACHKQGHYASHCPERKKGGNKMQLDVVASARAQEDEFAKKFEQTKFLLVSQTSLGTISVGAWLIDSGATCQMAGAWELFESFTESHSDMYVELGMGTKHAVQGSGTIQFQME
jgi:hypothetical protein